MTDRFVSAGILLLAIMLAGVTFYVLTSRQQLAVAIYPRLSMRIVSVVGGTPRTVSAIGPVAGIGTPGGVLASTRYLQDGANGLYPVYTTDTSGTIHVESRVVRSYTLGDFFEVWGKPLGPTNTLGLAQNGTIQSGLFVKDFFWDMCLVNPGASSSSEYVSYEWGSHLLRDGEIIDLVYSRVGCA
jgi:hypothetical protein